jgi:hypothetical protein
VQIFENVAEKVKKGKAYVNMYEAFRTFRSEGLTAEERARFNKKMLKEESSLFASHPTYGERCEAAKPLPKAPKLDNASAMSLFSDPTQAEKEMTDFLFEVAQRVMRR